MKWFRGTPLREARWIVIDCETSGLDAARDRLLSVGAVLAEGGRIAASHVLHRLVQQTVASSRDNILVHGIGGDAQLGGRPAVEVIEELARLGGGRVPVGFHAPFDAQVLRRYGFRGSHPWLDLAQLAPAVFPQRRLGDTLDEWLEAFGIDPVVRHDALADAFATAQLLLVVLAAAAEQGLGTLQALLNAQRAGRWLAPG